MDGFKFEHFQRQWRPISGGSLGWVSVKHVPVLAPHSGSSTVGDERGGKAQAHRTVLSTGPLKAFKLGMGVNIVSGNVNKGILSLSDVKGGVKR